MAGSAQKQMEHTFVPVWKDTRELTVKVNCLPASSTNPFVYRTIFTDEYYPSGDFSGTGTMG